MTTPPNDTFDPMVKFYDRAMAPLERLWFKDLRQRLLGLTVGRTLEIGVGTGASLPFYPQNGCLVAIDESAEMLASAAMRAAGLGRCVLLNHMDADHLAFPDGAFDTVVASLVLCSVMDQQATLHELKRVLRRPGGVLLLLEHTRPDHPTLGRLVDLANKPWYALNKRCNVNRRTGEEVAAVGFEVDEIESRMAGLFRLIVARVP